MNATRVVVDPVGSCTSLDMAVGMCQARASLNNMDGKPTEVGDPMPYEDPPEAHIRD